MKHLILTRYRHNEWDNAYQNEYVSKIFLKNRYTIKFLLNLSSSFQVLFLPQRSKPIQMVHTEVSLINNIPEYLKLHTNYLFIRRDNRKSEKA